MGILDPGTAAEADVIQQIPDDHLDLALAAGQLMKADRLCDDVAHLHARVHRGVGVLEHHLHLATQRATLALALEGSQIDPLKDDFAGIRRIETGDGAGNGRFT